MEDVTLSKFLDIKNQYDGSDRASVTWEHLIAQIALRIRESLSLPSILQITADETHQLLKCDRVLLYQFAPDWSGQVVVEAVSAPEFSLIERVHRDFCFEDSWLKPYQDGHISSRADIAAAPDLTPCHAEFLASFQVRANLVVPILSQSQLWGFLIAHNCATPRQWLPEEINGLQQTAVHVGIALYQADLLERLQAAKADLEAQVQVRTSELTETNQRLLQSEARFQYLAAHVPSMIYTIVFPQNAPTYFEYISSAVIDISEITPEQVYADMSLLFRQWHPGDMAGWEAISRRSLTNLEPLFFEWRIITPSGTVKWLNVHASVERRQNGDMARYGVVSDISDRKQVAAKLEQVSKRLALSLKSGGIGCWDWDISQNIVLWDDRMYELYGITKQSDSVVYDIWANGIHPDDRSYTETLLQQAVLGQAEYDTEFRVIHPDRSIHFIKAYGVVVCDDQGNPTRILGVNFDISDRKQSELKLESVNQQLSDHIAELNQRHGEMVTLSEISDFLQACLTVEEACNALSKLIEPLFPNCAGGVFITNTSRNRVEVMSCWGESLQSEDSFLPKDCWALRRGRPHFHTDNGVSCNHIPSNEAITATLCIPMIAQGETIGLFYLSTNISNALSKPKQQLARTLAEQVSMAISNLRLQETLQQQSIRDPLTGLFNRRYLEETLNRELSRAQRQQHQISVIMIDLDHFKKFNDTYGHDAGDYVLQTVGTLLKKYVRGSDIACRYGGEEMILVFPDSTLEAASMRAEEIREAIAQVSLIHNSQLLGSLTASFGIASFPQHSSTGSAVIQAADAALYRAKAAGRNQVVVAP